MASWPANGSTNWNDAMSGFIDIEHNSDGTHNVKGVYAKLKITGTQDISATTSETLELNTLDFESTTGMCDTANYRITPGVAGYYIITAYCVLGEVSAAHAYITIYKTGSVSLGASSSYAGSAAATLYLNVATIVPLTAEEYVYVKVYNGDGGTRTTGSGQAWLSLAKIGRA